MKASELVAKLNAAIAKHGDHTVSVYVNEAEEPGMPEKVKLVKSTRGYPYCKGDNPYEMGYLNKDEVCFLIL